MKLISTLRNLGVGGLVVTAHILSFLIWLMHDQLVIGVTAPTNVPINVQLPMTLSSKGSVPIPRIFHKGSKDQMVRSTGEVRIDSLSADSSPLESEINQGKPADAAMPGSVQSNSDVVLELRISLQLLNSPSSQSAADRSAFHARKSVTVETQISDVFAESGPWQEERIDVDHIRIRRGSTCVVLERPMASIIDPFSEAAKRIPWGAGPQFKC
jgi:hypothetical protein